MKKGDIFYAVMQKDNDPFAQPRITKFEVENILDNSTHPIMSTKTDKWGRHYFFKESQVYLTRKDALPKRQELLNRIEEFEKNVEEMNKKYAQAQIKRDEIEKNKRAVECLVDLVNHIKENEFPCYEAGSECCYSGELIGYIYGKISQLRGEDIKWLI